MKSKEKHYERCLWRWEKDTKVDLNIKERKGKF
jgi:hypothetical protein